MICDLHHDLDRILLHVECTEARRRITLLKAQSRSCSAAASSRTSSMLIIKMIRVSCPTPVKCRCTESRQRIVLPEGVEPRVLHAAEQITRRGLADILLLGNEDEVKVKGFESTLASRVACHMAPVVPDCCGVF